MKVSHIIALLGLGVFITFPAQAYTYKFLNKSDKEAEVEFQLAGINEPIETLRVPPMTNDGKPGSASKSIGGWRIGLWLKVDSIHIRSLPDPARNLPDTRFKTPVWTNICLNTDIMGPCAKQPDYFDLVLQTKRFDQLKNDSKWYDCERNAKNTAEFAECSVPIPNRLLSYDQTFTFTFTDGLYPVIKKGE